MKYYVGIDIGTSSVKLTLIDSMGRIIRTAGREYMVSEPAPGWKEIDPELWMQAIDEGIEELLSDIDHVSVKKIGVTGQMHTVILLDQKGKVIRPALMWNDTRTADLIPKIRAEIEKNPKIAHINKILSTGSPAMNLLWVKENEPENFKRLKKFLIGPDYIVYRLTGTMQTDYCEASTSSLCNLKDADWSPEIRELLEFPEEIYPEIKGSGEIAGTLQKEYQQKYKLNKEVQILVGTGDNPAAAIATGCFEKKYPVMSFGTSGVLMFPREWVAFDAKGKNILFSIDGEEKMVLVQGVVQSCGGSLAWWIKKILNSSDYDEEIGKADTAHLGENSILFYPHLVGDKTIYADPKLRGSFFGLGTDTSRLEMTISVLEGICFGVKQLTEEMKIPKEQIANLRVTGGGSKNEIWMQIMADILNVPVIQMESNAGAGYGMAMLAAQSDGIEIQKILKQTIVEKKKFYPREYNASLYEKKYGTYCKIYQAVKMISDQR